MILTRDDFHADLDGLISEAAESLCTPLAALDITTPDHVLDVACHLIRDRLPALTHGLTADGGSPLGKLITADPALFATDNSAEALRELLMESRRDDFAGPVELDAWVSSKIRRALKLGPDEIRAECYALRRERASLQVLRAHPVRIDPNKRRIPPRMAQTRSKRIGA